MVTTTLLILAASVAQPICGLARADASAQQALYGAAAASDGVRVYALGGQEGSKVSSTLMIFERGRARPIYREVTPVSPRRYHAVLVQAPWLYVIGGEGAGVSPPTERLNLETMKVETLAPLPQPRPFVSAAWHDGKIYVVGGETKQGHTARVDVYDVVSGAWSEGPPLAEGRDARLVDVDGALFAVGGYLGDDRSSSMVERLAPGSSKWAPVADLPAPTSAHAVVALGGKVHVLGDYTELSRALSYDVASDAWSVVPSSFTARRHAAAAAAGGWVFLVGGNRLAKGPGTPLIESFAPACAEVPSLPTCEAVRDHARDVPARLQPARALCGAVVDIDRRLAEAARARDDRAGMFEHLERSLLSASNTPAALARVHRLARKGLPPEEHARLVALGRDPARPLYVATVEDEYRWLKRFGCPLGQEAKRTHQSLRKDGIDVLEIECAGTAAAPLHFDHSTMTAQARP